MVARIAAIVVALTLSGCTTCTQYISRPTITTPTGEKQCARHRIPLVTIPGFTTRQRLRDLKQRQIVLYHTYYMQLVVETCNPNSTRPWYSLTRKTPFTVASSVTYCPKCQQAVDANLASPNPFRMPSRWEQIRSGVYIPESSRTCSNHLTRR